MSKIIYSGDSFINISLTRYDLNVKKEKNNFPPYLYIEKFYDNEAECLSDLVYSEFPYDANFITRFSN